MQVLDAEYQFDRHKLTFFFEADRRIDFRELVSELFSLYKTRIWMQQVDISTVSPLDAGIELAKATGFLPEGREDIVSTRSSFATSTEERLSCASLSDLATVSGGDIMNDKIPAIELFRQVKGSKTQPSSTRQSFDENNINNNYGNYNYPNTNYSTSTGGSNSFSFSDTWQH
jgi:hypothetical protein